jgi:predicted nucleic acid-binding protein
VRDRDHTRATYILAELDVVRVPILAVAEAAYVIQRRAPGREAYLAASFSLGEMFAENVAAADWERIAELVHQYADLPLGTVDASIVAAAERLGVRHIVTFDRRDFGIVRPSHVEAFELLPD